MTELTYMPNPEELLNKLRSVNLDLFVAGNTEERANLKDAATWLLVFLHSLDIELIPTKHRDSFEDTAREAGKILGAILCRLETADSEQSRTTVAELYTELRADAVFACGVFSQHLASELSEHTKWPTPINS